jgi:hypothetical protein
MNYPTFQDTLKQVYNELKDAPIEHAVVINKDGRILARAKGTKHQVSVAVNGLRLSTASHIHNHPPEDNGSGQDVGFSSADFKACLFCKIKTWYVITPKSCYKLQNRNPDNYLRAKKIVKFHERRVNFLIRIADFIWPISSSVCNKYLTWAVDYVNRLTANTFDLEYSKVEL